MICDRFSDSTRVYQGVAGGLAPAMLDRLEDMVVAATRPNLTLILDLPAEVGLARAASRRPSGADAAVQPDAYEKRDSPSTSGFGRAMWRSRRPSRSAAFSSMARSGRTPSRRGLGRRSSGGS